MTVDPIPDPRPPAVEYIEVYQPPRWACKRELLPASGRWEDIDDPRAAKQVLGLLAPQDAVHLAAKFGMKAPLLHRANREAYLLLAPCVTVDPNGRVCRFRVEPGKDACRLHLPFSTDSAATVGRALGPRKTGRYSKYLPARYLEAFEAALTDDALGDLRQQMALLEAREIELIQRLERGESGASWQAANRALDDLTEALQSGDVALQRKAFTGLQAVLRRGVGDEKQWAEIRENIEYKRRLVETDRKRIESMQAYLTAEQVMGLVSKLIGMIRSTVVDQESRVRLVSSIRQMMLPAWEGAEKHRAENKDAGEPA